MTLPNFLKSKLAFAVSVFILILLTLSVLQKNTQQANIDKEKRDLEKQAFEIERKNEELQKSLEYLSSDSSKEKIARSQLNLKKQGETVYSFLEGSETNLEKKQSSLVTESNFKQWLFYFAKSN